ncbi:MAG TPA: hypothetical protein VGV18_05500, partial [Verrucomicrobiae bacterium]|nr:hypothetical protein [Verrucomicrobiae bacterium]
LVFGTAGGIGYVSQNVPTVPGQSYILSFWLADPQGGTVAQFLANWNNNIIYNVLNPPAFDWSNLVFYVTATTTNTFLQFGARNDNATGLFGLDDVSVTPIPSFNPSLVAQGPNTVSLTWNSLAGATYQVQYSTNLLSTNWSTLSTNTAAGPTLSLTVPVTSPWAFYRIAVP